MGYRFLKIVVASALLVHVWSATLTLAEDEGSEAVADEELSALQSGSEADDQRDPERAEDDTPVENRSTHPIRRLPRSYKRAAVMSDEANRMTALATEFGAVIRGTAVPGVTIRGADEAVWLGGEEGLFFSLFRPESTGSPQGGIILIHENGGHPAQPGVIEGIRTWLPDYGWSTLAISVPEIKQARLPPRTRPVYVRWKRPDQDPATDQPDVADANSSAEASPDLATDAELDSDADPAPQSDTESDDNAAADASQPAIETAQGLPEEATWEDDSQLVEVTRANSDSLSSLFNVLDRRISASIRYMQESKGQYNLIFLGVGSGAHLLARYAQSQLAAGKAAAIQGLVFVNAKHNLQPGAARPGASLPELLANLYMPILDLYQGNSARNIENAKKRIDQAHRFHLNRYTQIRIPPVSHQAYSSNNRVIRRVRGWLAKYAEGMEVEKAKP